MTAVKTTFANGINPFMHGDAARYMSKSERQEREGHLVLQALSVVGPTQSALLPVPMTTTKKYDTLVMLRKRGLVTSFFAARSDGRSGFCTLWEVTAKGRLNLG